MGKLAKIQIFEQKLGQKVRMTVAGAQNRTGFLEKGPFDKHFMYDIQKRGSPGKNFRVFSPRYP